MQTVSQPESTSRRPECTGVQTRTADAIVDVLMHHGVEVVFGLPGGTIAPVLDALLDKDAVTVITTKHESGAMFAAAGYARVTGKIGVVCVTSGPGVLNAVTGLASAHCEGLPLLLLVGEVPLDLHGRGALQEGTEHQLNVLAMTRLVSKLSAQITQPEAAVPMVVRGIQTALSGRQGPVVLTLPLDVGRRPVRSPRIASGVRLDCSGLGSDHPCIERSARALYDAKRPVILAGCGVRHGRAREELYTLAMRAQVPVMTTPKAKGLFPETHPLSLGVFGHGGHPSATEYLDLGVDVVLAVGSRLSDPSTDGWSRMLVPSREFIQIDVDATHLGRNYAMTEVILGDAESILRSIHSVLREARTHRSFGRRYHADPAAHPIGSERLITPQRALWELQQCLPRDTVYACDIGEHLLFATHYLSIDPPGEFVLMNALASMGSGLGAALGVQIARRERTVVAICGDGTFAMHGAEISTAAAAGLGLIVFVINDRRFGMVELGNEAIYGRTPAYSTAPLNVAEFARAQGVEAIVIRGPGELLRADLGRPRVQPLVLDVHVDRSSKMPKNKRFEELARASAPLSAS